MRNLASARDLQDHFLSKSYAHSQQRQTFFCHFHIVYVLQNKPLSLPITTVLQCVYRVFAHTSTVGYTACVYLSTYDQRLCHPCCVESSFPLQAPNWRRCQMGWNGNFPAILECIITVARWLKLLPILRLFQEKVFHTIHTTFSLCVQNTKSSATIQRRVTIL